MSTASSPLETLTRHFQRKLRRDEPPPPDRAALAAAVEQTRAHAGMHALLALVVDRNIQFEPFDFIMTPHELIREGHPWTLGGSTVGPDDVPIARNRAGDLYVFDAATGATRFLIHDEGWRRRSLYPELDGLFLDVMLAVVENIPLDALPEGERAEDLRVAVEIAGEYMSDEWHALAIDAGLLPGG